MAGYDAADRDQCDDAAPREPGRLPERELGVPGLGRPHPRPTGLRTVVPSVEANDEVGSTLEQLGPIRRDEAVVMATATVEQRLSHKAFAA